MSVDEFCAICKDLDDQWDELNSQYERGDLSLEDLARFQLNTTRTLMQIALHLFAAVS